MAPDLIPKDLTLIPLAIPKGSACPWLQDPRPDHKGLEINPFSFSQGFFNGLGSRAPDLIQFLQLFPRIFNGPDGVGSRASVAILAQGMFASFPFILAGFPM